MKSIPLLLLGLGLATVALAAPSRPNVVFILADDLGWADTTLYGHTKFHETPHLARLAQRGMLFTRAYSASPLCSPTRASILTGQTPARTGFTAPNGHSGEVILKPTVQPRAPADSKALQAVTITRLATSYPTLGKLFKQAGYATAHFGKWHLGAAPYSPREHGFDVDLPNNPGPGPAGSFVAPWKYKNFKENQPQEHIEDRMAEEAVKWLRSLPKGQPFYMNYWMFSVHAPFDAKSAYIAQYRGKIDPRDAQHSPTYAAMVKSMDDAIGTLLDALDAAGVADNTIIVFTSDNGGNMYNGIREKDSAGKNFVTTPTSNRPLRGGKATVFEGGIRVPTVVVWPQVTKPGSRSDEIIQSTDYYLTLLAAAGLPPPAGHPVDGTDLAPVLRGGRLDRAGIFTFFPHSPSVPDWLPPAMAVHSGDWKLIRLFHQGEKGAHAYRLYNLKDDIGETRDLASAQPAKVRELDQLIQNHLVQTRAVVPLPNPAFNPSQYQPDKIGKQPGGLKVGGDEKAKGGKKAAAE